MQEKNVMYLFVRIANREMNKRKNIQSFPS